MSHEIRTPMNSILGMAELIQRKAVSSEIQEYIQIIHQSGDNLRAIINDILDFSKIESGRLQIQKRDYYIASVINDMINMTRPRIAEKSLDFFVNVDSSIPEQLYGDDMRLRQVLTNLLTNAVKYTRKGFVSLDVKAERIDNASLKLSCMVEDSGIGIKVEDHKFLFSEFARIDAKANQGIEGTGLGLTITRALCRAMGGDVKVVSEYGRGSSFCAEIIQEFHIDEPVAVINNPEKKHVLFYDWRPQYVKSLSTTLESLNIKYKCSSSFQEFVKDLEFGEYDYAFISSKYAMDCIYVLGARTTPMQLVIMVEPGEISVYREVTSILMPIYSITMANVLNDTSDGILFQDAKLKMHFTAPSAKILIVDDISTNLRVAKELMAPYEMNIHTCLSGSEALNLVKNHRYDLVFMDHMMPGMDGIEATSFIRNLKSEDGYYQDLPIIALTANALSGQREMFLENGINDFLAKPIDIQRLDEILEKWLLAEKLVVSTYPHRHDAKQDKTEALPIPGVDTALGMRNCGGGTEIYLNILEDFCKDAETRLVQISESFTQRDSKLYITLVHALKGAARSIGALEAGEKASWLEKAASSGDLAAIKDKTTDLQENIRALINNIEAALEKYEAEHGRELIDVSSLKLGELKKALANMDIEAVNRMLLDYAGLALDAKTKSMISEVEQYILMFEYEKAIEKINELF
jgi:CheY-like chemotaxis protein